MNGIKARDLQRAVMLDLWQRNTVMPNYTPNGWYECDVFEVTKAGFFREYEVKISRSDFRNDQTKGRLVWNGQSGSGYKEEKEIKHHLIKQRDLRGPTAFYFVTPAGLLKPDEIPEWAGLIEGRRLNTTHSRVFIQTVKKAPVLHRTKFDPDGKKLDRLYYTCYFRYARLWMNNALDPQATNRENGSTITQIEAEPPEPDLLTQQSQQVAHE